MLFRSFAEKSADSFPIEGQIIAQESAVPHVVIYRRSVPNNGSTPPSGNPDIPNYWQDPETAAQEHWAWHKANLPPEHDPAVTWVEIINEPAQHFDFEPGDIINIPVMWGRERVELPNGRIRITNGEWLAQFAVEAATLALTDGYKLAMFGFSTGEPEPEVWEWSHMQAFLAMCTQHPDRLAVALHEYSLRIDCLWSTVNESGPVPVAGFQQSDLVGRFRHMADAWPGVTILITEFGWTHDNVPAPDTAVAHIHELADVLVNYPQVKAVNIWYLGPGFGGIAIKAQRLIDPLRVFLLDYVPELPECPGQPREQYRRVYWVLAAGTSEADYLNICRQAFEEKRTVGFSYDDAGIGALNDKTAVLWGIPSGNRPIFSNWFAMNYPGTAVLFDGEGSAVARAFRRAGASARGLLAAQSDCFGEPREQYGRVCWVLPISIGLDAYLEVCRQAYYDNQRTVGFSYDDGGIGNLANKTAVLWGIPAEQRAEFTQWFTQHYPGTLVEFRDLPLAGIQLRYRPCDTTRITQHFGDNPQNYIQFGFPGHEGLDFGVALGLPYYAAADGRVVHASDRRWSSDTASNYGWHVVIDHGGFCTVYAHAQAGLPVSVGQQVDAGQIVGYSGNTGNSSGPHLHFGLLDKTGMIDTDNGYPPSVYGRYVDPEPWVSGLDAPTQTPPPATGSARIGLHASADNGQIASGPGGTAEFVEFKTLKPGIIKVLSGHWPQDITRLYDDQASVGNVAGHWIVRAFLDFGGRNISSAQFVNDTINDVARAVAVLRGKGVPMDKVWIELHNEPNLTPEGWGGAWADGYAFAAWGLEVLRLYKQQLPNVRYLFPGLSPGGDVPGLRTDATRFLADSAAFARACDGIGAHAYWLSTADRANALGWVAHHESFNKPIWVTEASFKTPTTADEMAVQYKAFHQELRTRPLVQGVTFFVASASNPAFRDECWVVDGQSRGIAQRIVG